MKKLTLFLFFALIFSAIEAQSYMATVHFNNGREKHKKKDYTGAIEDFNKALEANPVNSDAYYFRGDAKYNLLDYAGSISDFTKVIEILSGKGGPFVSGAYYMLGVLKYYQKDYTGSVSDLTKAIGFSPDLVNLYFIRGRAYLKLGNIGEANKDFSKTLEMQIPGIFKAFTLHFLNKDDEAVKDAKATLDKDPSMANYYDAATFYSVLNKIPEAINSLDLAFGKGFTNYKYLLIDEDLSNISNTEEYKNLLNKYKINQK